MDEVDGMSAGDRGGVGALNVLIKKTRVSAFLVAVIQADRVDPDGAYL
jgi:replication factor C subunit 1